jgi:hypothetical protein
MTKTIIRLLYLTLSLILITSTLTGCLSEEEVIPEIVPEEQIFEDSYERNSEITDIMTYSIDYITSERALFSSMDVLTLFNHIKVQVDNWECVTVGTTTMGEIATLIDSANSNYIAEKTNEIIAERQAVIDAEYEERVKNAEEKGKTYDKPKKEVRTDDIHFDNPYTYTVTLGDNKKAEPIEYQKTLLVDPSTYRVIYFDVAKYGIPYVRFEFKMANNTYNTRITQESDWVMNGVKAADVSSYGLSEDGKEQLETIPSFVDADGLNKAAKQNIYMSGNIAFGGEGFNWDSLMLLCNALELVEDERHHSFKQSSDDNFTYYTIMLYTNIFESNPEYIDEEKVYFPCTRLIATFDPLTQVCLNWTVDTYTASQSFHNKVHDISDPVNVNVHEYKVDTNNYENMRDTIKYWIDSNAIKTTTAYCALDRDNNDKMFGVVETGMSNISIEVTIDGILYSCLGYSENGDGSIFGTYVTVDDLNKAETMEAEDANKYINSHTKNLTIACCVLNEDGEILGRVVDGINMLTWADGIQYHIADYELTDAGYKNVRVLTEELVSKLLMVYTKTYKLDAVQNTEIQSIFRHDGVMAVRNYIDELFAEAEEAQKKQQAQQEAQANNEINKFTIKGKQFDIENFTTKQLKQCKFEAASKHYVLSQRINFTGISYMGPQESMLSVTANENEIVDVLIAESDVATFYKGLKVGMTPEEVKRTLDNEYTEFQNNELWIDNGKYTIILKTDSFDEKVVSIFLIKNSYFKNMPDQKAVEQYGGITHNINGEGATATWIEGKSGITLDLIDTNTELNLYEFKIADNTLDIRGLTSENLNQIDFSMSEDFFSIESDFIDLRGMMYQDGDGSMMGVSEGDGGDVYAILADSEILLFANGIHVGMTTQELDAALASEEPQLMYDFMILKNNQNTLMIGTNDEGLVDTIYLLNNDSLVLLNSAIIKVQEDWESDI